jgi:transposase-like protein
MATERSARPEVRGWGRWRHLHRAVDSAGATIEFLLSELRDADAAKRLFRKALSHLFHPQPGVIYADLAPIYGSAVPDLKKEEPLQEGRDASPPLPGTDPHSI